MTERVSRGAWLRRHGWVLGGLSAAWLAARFFPFHEFRSMCAIRRGTGLPCLTCGFTRAFASLTRGQWEPVWRECPGAIPFFLFFAAVTIALLGGLIMGWSVMPGARWTGRGRPWAWALAAAMAVLLANWVYRLRNGLV